MNTNPWFLERMAEYEMDRIQRDMKQIRLEEEAQKKIQRKLTHIVLASLCGSRPPLSNGYFAWAGKFTDGEGQ